MNFKNVLFFLVFIAAFFSCSEDADSTVARNLQEYIDQNSNKEFATFTAFAANAAGNQALSYIFYVPEQGATDIRYYEMVDADAATNDFTNYRRKSLSSASVFGGKLGRFSRSGETETWCLVTCVVDGKLHISDLILLKNKSKTTQYTNDVSITYTTTTTPKFIWQDAATTEQDTYLQILTDNKDNFISGTYTKQQTFQFYDESNIVASLNETTPNALVADEIYNFTMINIGEDNWVDLIIEEQFIPKNLQEYITENTDKTQQQLLAFAGTANGNIGLTYVYFHIQEGAYEYRYYETNTATDETDFSNYQRKNLNDVAVFNGKFRRFSRESSKEVWCIVTYIADGKLYVSKPIKKKNLSRQTEWQTTVNLDVSESLKPKFTWNDGVFLENQNYVQIISSMDDEFLSGTITTEKSFQYNTESNDVSKIEPETVPDLIFDTEYKFFLFGISSDNWINLIIQDTFIVQ